MYVDFASSLIYSEFSTWQFYQVTPHHIKSWLHRTDSTTRGDEMFQTSGKMLLLITPRTGTYLFHTPNVRGARRRREEWKEIANIINFSPFPSRRCSPLQSEDVWSPLSLSLFCRNHSGKETGEKKSEEGILFNSLRLLSSPPKKRKDNFRRVFSRKKSFCGAIERKVLSDFFPFLCGKMK